MTDIPISRDTSQVILLGITGAIGHGKSTFAEALRATTPDMLHLETNMPILEIANGMQGLLLSQKVHANDDFATQWLSSLPKFIEEYLHQEVSLNEVVPTQQYMHDRPTDFTKLMEYLQLMVAHPELVGTTITADNKDTYRSLLQWLGAYLISRLGRLVWIGEIMERARSYEAEGGKLAVVGGVRSQEEAELIQDAGGMVLHISRPETAEQDLADPTEASRSQIAANATIINDGSISDLTTVAAAIITALHSGQPLEQTYQASAVGVDVEAQKL